MRVVVLILMVFLTSTVQAQKLEGLKTYNAHFGSDSGSAKLKEVPSAATLNTGLEILFGMQNPPAFDNNGQSFPPLPRFWGSEGRRTFVDQTTGAGVYKFVTAEVKLNYTYEVISTFHFLGSAKILNRPVNADLVTYSPEDFARVFIKDENTPLDYFNVSEKNKMVGMCQYEIGLYHGLSAKGGITWFLSSIIEGGEVNFARFAVYSKLFDLKSRKDAEKEAIANGFQVDPNYYQGDGFETHKYSLKWYKEDFCTKHFEKTIKPFVEEAFGSRAVEFNAYNNPANTCVLGSRRIKTGDESCVDHHMQMNSSIRKSAVSRCEIVKDGTAQCRLRARENMPCPLYFKKEGGYSDKWQGYYTEATLSNFGNPCDSGLVCQMDKKPIGIGSFMIWPGSATCKKKPTERRP